MTRSQHRNMVVLAKRLWKSQVREDRLDYSIQDFQKMYYLTYEEGVIVQHHLHVVLNQERKFKSF